jgi:hypothetical protein
MFRERQYGSDPSVVRRSAGLDAIDWLIVGGESGPGARRLELEWAFELMRACDEVRTAFFMKQLGTQLGRELGARDQKGGDINTFPSVLRRREMPARKANPAVLRAVSESSCTRSVPARRSEVTV